MHAQTSREKQSLIGSLLFAIMSDYLWDVSQDGSFLRHWVWCENPHGSCIVHFTIVAAFLELGWCESDYCFDRATVWTSLLDHHELICLYIILIAGRRELMILICLSEAVNRLLARARSSLQDSGSLGCSFFSTFSGCSRRGWCTLTTLSVIITRCCCLQRLTIARCDIISRSCQITQHRGALCIRSWFQDTSWWRSMPTWTLCCIRSRRWHRFQPPNLLDNLSAFLCLWVYIIQEVTCVF